MHIVQSKILDKLTYADKLRYSELRPEKTESNLFAYHLKCLIKDDYIDKVDSSYQLSSKGKSYVDKISHRSLKVRWQPKIITLLDIVNDKGETLMFRRKHQPYIEMLAYPTGKLHMFENVKDSALREISEKLEFKPFDIEHRGIVYVTVSENGVDITQVLAHVFHGHTNQEFAPDDTKRAARFWADPSTFADKEFLPGFWEIKELLRSKEFFFDELKFDLADYS